MPPSGDDHRERDTGWNALLAQTERNRATTASPYYPESGDHGETIDRLPFATR